MAKKGQARQEPGLWQRIQREKEADRRAIEEELARGDDPMEVNDRRALFKREHLAGARIGRLGPLRRRSSNR